MSVVALRAVFDFNRDPFLPGFVGIQVEGSPRHGRPLPSGADGRLAWGDLQTGGAVVPAGQRTDDLAVCMIPMG